MDVRLFLRQCLRLYVRIFEMQFLILMSLLIYPHSVTQVLAMLHYLNSEGTYLHMCEWEDTKVEIVLCWYIKRKSVYRM